VRFEGGERSSTVPGVHVDTGLIGGEFSAGGWDQKLVVIGRWGENNAQVEGRLGVGTWLENGLGWVPAEPPFRLWLRRHGCPAWLAERLGPLPGALKAGQLGSMV